MPRDIPVGNGTMLVAFDADYILREFYFPYVGQESHTNGEPFRFGVWVNGVFRWLPQGWRISLDYLDETLVTQVRLTQDELGLEIVAHDTVDFHENIYVKKMIVRNFSARPADVRIFLCHNFSLSGNDIGDTAAYRPELRALWHYKGQRHFLINACVNQRCGIDQFATGNKQRNAAVGTWKDAEDGVLSGNPIAQGSVDSVAGLHLKLEAGEQQDCFYWICAGKNWSEVETLNRIIWDKTPPAILKRTADYWHLWVNKEATDFADLPEKISWLYKRSLLIMRTHIDNHGAIIAANDSDTINFNQDTYSYLWPRDGALAAYALDLAGYSEITRRFFNLCARVIEKDGYLLHKYNPDGSLASSWHPWMANRSPRLPIQEDETALVIWALWHHFQLFRDIEFIKPLYKPLIKNAADFMVRYRDSATNLPLPSYDLWEERWGVFAFTAAAVFGGLTAAAAFAEAFGEQDAAARYRNAAQELIAAMDTYFYMEKEQRFASMLTRREDGGWEVDATLDASLYGLFAFGAYDVGDQRVRSTIEQMVDRLWCKTQGGGMARKQDDYYYRVSSEVPGNPWLITTLWLAQYHIAGAQDESALAAAMRYLQWGAERALPSGVLAEQINPYTNTPVSVAPLTWSHATFVMVVQLYLRKKARMKAGR